MSHICIDTVARAFSCRHATLFSAWQMTFSLLSDGLLLIQKKEDNMLYL
jgi:hypothetical protein